MIEGEIENYLEGDEIHEINRSLERKKINKFYEILDGFDGHEIKNAQEIIDTAALSRNVETRNIEFISKLIKLIWLKFLPMEEEFIGTPTFAGHLLK